MIAPAVANTDAEQQRRIERLEHAAAEAKRINDYRYGIGRVLCTTEVRAMVMRHHRDPPKVPHVELHYPDERLALFHGPRNARRVRVRRLTGGVRRAA